MSRRARSTIAAVFALAAVLGPAAATSQADPVVVLSYYNSRDLGQLVSALTASGLPSGTAVYYGNYYGSSPPKKPGHKPPPQPPPPPVDVPGGRMSPIFSWAPSKFWEKRRLSAEEKPHVTAPARLSGAAPPLAKLLAKPSATRFAWGQELGRRFRDRVREVRAKGTNVVSWQFDEIPSNAIGPQGKAVRDVVRGMLDGVRFGRAELGDTDMPGVVFMANRTLELTRFRPSAELESFWQAIDGASTSFVGEEYPKFVGDPERQAFVQGAGQRHLQQGDAVMQSLARKYVVGITPGYNFASPGLGGNIHGLSRDGARRWRADFLDERARMGVAGFAAFNFRNGNDSAKVQRDVMAAFGEALQYLPPQGTTP